MDLNAKYRKGNKKTGRTNNTCVFSSDYKCRALSDYYCDNCNFYKSKKEYYLDAGGFAQKRNEVK